MAQQREFISPFSGPWTYTFPGRVPTFTSEQLRQLREPTIPPQIIVPQLTELESNYFLFGLTRNEQITYFGIDPATRV